MATDAVVPSEQRAIVVVAPARDTIAAMTKALGLMLALGACSGGGATVDAAGPDAPTVIDDAAVDGPGACEARTYAARPATSVWLLDDRVSEGRTVRAAVAVTLDRCDLRAIPEVAIDPVAHTVTITAAVFALPAPCGPGERQVRPVAFRVGAGTWTVRAVGAPEALTLTVAPPPARACGAVTAGCELDCDCPRGERCLGGLGLAGQFTACATPCELDRDCGGDGRCESLDDGLEFACVTGPECDADRPCPTGFACEAGACTPTFRLDQGTRHVCTCDADCDPGLRCLTDDLGAGRCEVACPTDGPWCQGAHVCGPATADASGLARTDSVCGWLGE